ncbi:hypothetical protein [Trichloromonas sp.]|uniref:hypothetical protein n=1 Tax=Trichloromonas sp. TaxID=3069249 RepID=UPI003D81919C
MSEGLTIKQITIVRIITMLGGFLGSLVVLFEQDVFWGKGYQSSTVSNVLVAIVGVLCFFNLIRHILVWRRISKPEA